MRTTQLVDSETGTTNMSSSRSVCTPCYKNAQCPPTKNFLPSKGTHHCIKSGGCSGKRTQSPTAGVERLAGLSSLSPQAHMCTAPPSGGKWIWGSERKTPEHYRAGMGGKEESYHAITSVYITVHIYTLLDEPSKTAGGGEEKGRGSVLKPHLAIPLMMQPLSRKKNRCSVFSLSSKSVPFLCSRIYVLTGRFGATEACIPCNDLVEGTLWPPGKPKISFLIL